MQGAPLDLLPQLPERDIVLVGGGHTHLHIVRRWRMQPIPGVRLTLVTPFRIATYSGMLPGTLAGLYRPAEMQVDVGRLATSCGCRLIVDELAGLDLEQRRVLLADRPPIRFDLCSVGIGSVPSRGDVWGRQPHVLSIKPMARFVSRLEQLVVARRAASRGGPDAASAPLSAVIVGAGAGGTEICLGLHTWFRARHIPAQLTLLDAHPQLLRNYSAGTRRHVLAALAEKRIEVRLGERVADVSADAVHLEGGDVVRADLVVWATSAAPPAVFERLPLAKAADGFLAIRPTLQSTSDPAVFAVGDSGSFPENPVPKAGVYAVREGPVLWHNLGCLLRGEPLREYVPQRGFLSLLATGDGSAIGEYHGWSARGTWVWSLKDHIDRKFMRMYQDYPAPMPHPPRARRSWGFGSEDGSPQREAAEGLAAMRCAGCGGKVGKRVLEQALGRLSLPPDRRLSVGLHRPDDAVVLARDTRVDVLSLDFFRAFLDDPYLVGRIAALHALGDIWAMGATPGGALAAVVLPEGTETQQVELLYQLLAGGQRELEAVGGGLWGGHTLEGRDILVGFQVTGHLGDETAWTKDRLLAGDRLILTKPLGTGALLAAAARAQASAAWMDGLMAGMLVSQAPVAAAGRRAGVQAATDITGFGLAGHLQEMLLASRCAAKVQLARIPLYAGFGECLGLGIRSTLEPANRRAATTLRVSGPAWEGHPAYEALFDPQTSGGLLLAVAPERVDAFLAELRGAGHPFAAEIGEVLPLGPGAEPFMDVQE